MGQATWVFKNRAWVSFEIFRQATVCGGKRNTIFSGSCLELPGWKCLHLTCFIFSERAVLCRWIGLEQVLKIFKWSNVARTEAGRYQVLSQHLSMLHLNGLNFGSGVSWHRSNATTPAAIISHFVFASAQYGLLIMITIFGSLKLLRDNAITYHRQKHDMSARKHRAEAYMSRCDASKYHHGQNFQCGARWHLFDPTVVPTTSTWFETRMVSRVECIVGGFV